MHIDACPSLFLQRCDYDQLGPGRFDALPNASHDRVGGLRLAGDGVDPGPGNLEGRPVWISGDFVPRCDAACDALGANPASDPDGTGPAGIVEAPSADAGGTYSIDPAGQGVTTTVAGGVGTGSMIDTFA